MAYGLDSLSAVKLRGLGSPEDRGRVGSIYNYDDVSHPSRQHPKNILFLGIYFVGPTTWTTNLLHNLKFGILNPSI